MKEQKDYYSPLQAASANRNLKMVQLLLEYGPKINMMGSMGTALQIACTQLGNIEIVKLLIEKGADVNAPGHPKHGQTALQCAILAGDMEVVEYLLGRRAAVSACAGKDFGFTALQAAVKMENSVLARRLIDMGALVNAKGSLQGAGKCLNMAARSGNVEMFNLLVNTAADFGDLSWPSTVLTDAISSGNHAMVERVLADRAALYERNTLHYGPAHVAAAVTHGSYDMVSMLLDFEISPNARDKDGRTPLQLAIRQDKPYMARELVLKGADVNTQNDDSSSALSDAIRKQDEDLVRFLLAAHATIDHPVTHELEAPIAVAIATGNLDMITIISGAGQRPFDDITFTGLIEAIRKDCFDAVQLLLSWGLQAQDMSTERYSLQGPLQQAIKSKNYKIIDLLLEHDEEFYSKDPRALVEAARIEDFDLVKRLLSLKSDFNGQGTSNFTYDEALIEAILCQSWKIPRVLIAAGADVNAFWENHDSADSRFPLNAAVMSGWFEMVLLCIRTGANVNGPARKRHRHVTPTPLQLAVKQGHSGMIRLLLESGASVNAAASEDAPGALQVAAENGRLDSVYKMLKHDKEPETLKRRIDLAAHHAEKKRISGRCKVSARLADERKWSEYAPTSTSLVGIVIISYKCVYNFLTF